MLLSRVLKVRYLAVVLLVLIVAASAYAFAAANNVPASGAGDGEDAISGYNVTNVHYTLDTDDSDQDRVRSVSDIAPTAGAAGTGVVRSSSSAVRHYLV